MGRGPCCCLDQRGVVSFTRVQRQVGPAQVAHCKHSVCGVLDDYERGRSPGGASGQGERGSGQRLPQCLTPLRGCCLPLGENPVSPAGSKVGVTQRRVSTAWGGCLPNLRICPKLTLGLQTASAISTWTSPNNPSPGRGRRWGNQGGVPAGEPRPLLGLELKLPRGARRLPHVLLAPGNRVSVSACVWPAWGRLPWNPGPFYGQDRRGGASLSPEAPPAASPAA